VKIAFYCPLKPIAHPTPSGDREIARGIYEFFQNKGAEIFVLSEFRTKDFYQSWTGVFQWVKELIRAYHLAKRENPDCFFTYHLYYKAPDPIAFLLAWWLQKPFYVFEGMYARKAARRFPFWPGYWLTKWALGYASRIYSDKTDDLAFLQLHFAKEKIRYIPPSLDWQQFSGRDFSWRDRANIAADLPVIVTTAMLRPDRKTEGVKFLIESLKLLTHPFHWVLIGDGQCRPEVEAIVKNYGWKNVSLLGAQSKEQIVAILRSANIFAFPGIDEGFGFVFVEAQAAGLPVVAFANGGIPDAVEKDKTGFLTTPFDAVEYAAKIQVLLENAELRSTMGEAGRQFVQRKFDRAKNYELMWQDLHLSNDRK
jgi:glycosyltransferase involved in cell wall biosynthesis